MRRCVKNNLWSWVPEWFNCHSVWVELDKGKDIRGERKKKKSQAAIGSRTGQTLTSAACMAVARVAERPPPEDKWLTHVLLVTDKRPHRQICGFSFFCGNALEQCSVRDWKWTYAHLTIHHRRGGHSVDRWPLNMWTVFRYLVAFDLQALMHPFSKAQRHPQYEFEDLKHMEGNQKFKVSQSGTA